MAFSSHPESEKAGQAIPAARPAYFPAAALYQTKAAAADDGAARSFQHAGSSDDTGHDRQPQLTQRFVRDPGFNFSGGQL